MVVPISYVDSQSTIHGINIDLNAAPETDLVGVDIYHSNDPFDHEVDSDSDLDVDEVLDDIDDVGVNEDGNVNASLVGNQIYCIVIHNNPRAHMSRIDPDPHIQPSSRSTLKYYLLTEWPYILILRSCSWARDLKIRKRAYFSLTVLEVGERLQLADTSCIYPEVADVGDTKIYWASHMHFNTYDRRSSKT
ncbi:hypothetical protein GOBAR_AA19550 [Gossypium barbadense]|uniref:Uncharacterized protein n=1 Tax=Gossypium barbadense TaxID=3634 RepID=A0A2P5XCP0_GOSBA|nr:hypothetical protein GOBAR_AA19550 [Gossypium barbadense]